MVRDTITLKGDKDVWQNFTLEAKRRKQEVWNILEPFIKRYSSFESEKIKKCIDAALKEYAASQIIDKLVLTEQVPDTDGHFTQIGHRPLIDIDFFQKDKDGVYRDPVLPSLGSTVAIGEINFLVHEIIKRKDIPVEEINKTDINVNFLSSKASALGFEPSILIPYDFYSKLYADKSAYVRIKHSTPMKLDNCNLVFLHKEVLKNEIILFDKSAILISFVPSYNFVTEKPEILQIEIGLMEKEGKTDILVRTLLKINILDASKVKIFQIKQ